MADIVELNDEVRRFIVTRLACFETPSEVAKAVKEDFGIEVSRQRVHAYDPTKTAGKALGPELRAIFETARREYLSETAEIGIASKVFRLRTLERLMLRAEGMGNLAMVLQTLEQAAKELGGAFTNRRELSGPNGGPIRTAGVHDLSDDELTAIAAGGSGGTAAPTEGKN